MMIGVAGMVGTGKTTLSLALARRFGLRPALESVEEDNPWLDLYYGEPEGRRKYGFELQLHFLASRMRHLRQMRREGGHWALDRTFYEDAEVFARGLFERGEMSAARWELYLALYRELRELPAAEPPAVLIYLGGPLDSILDRIRARGRPSELAVPDGYWRELHERYTRWIGGFHLCPVVRLDIRSYDAAADPAEMEEVVREVRRAAGIDLARLPPQKA